MTKKIMIFSIFYMYAWEIIFLTKNYFRDVIPKNSDNCLLLSAWKNRRISGKCARAPTGQLKSNNHSGSN